MTHFFARFFTQNAFYIPLGCNFSLDLTGVPLRVHNGVMSRSVIIRVSTSFHPVPVTFDVHLSTNMQDFMRAWLSKRENFAFLATPSNANDPQLSSLDINSVDGYQTVYVAQPNGLPGVTYYVLHTGMIGEVEMWDERV